MAGHPGGKPPNRSCMVVLPIVLGALGSFVYTVQDIVRMVA